MHGKTLSALTLVAALWSAPLLLAQDTPQAAKPQPASASGQAVKTFDELADKALVAMKQRAEQLNIKGAAVIAYLAEGGAKTWSSKMTVVGSHKAGSSSTDPGVNLIAIAYSKAAEMADTLKDSGSGIRPPMKGEFGWQGGLIVKGKTGYLIAAFSGGPAADDVKVSQAGLNFLAGKL